MAISEKLYAVLCKNIDCTPYYRHLGIECEKLDTGFAVLLLPVKHELSNPLGIAHGGAITTLADSAMGNALRATGKEGVTVDLNINFIAPGKIGDTLRAEAKVIHQGDRIVVLEAIITKDGGVMVAVARGTFMIIGNIEEG